MDAEKKLKKLELFLKGKWWEEVKDVALTVRKNLVLWMINHPKTSMPEYSEDDITKIKIQMINWFLSLPERLVSNAKKEVEEKEIENLEDTGDDLSIWDVDDLFVSKE